MRRLSLAILIFTAVAACTDSTPTATAPRSLDRVRSEVALTGTLEDNIQTIIAFWPKVHARSIGSRWDGVKALYQAGQTNPAKLADAKKALYDLTGYILKKTVDMNAPTTGETRQAAAARLIWYMLLYVYGDGTNTGNNVPVPPFDPGADNAVGLLTPKGSLTLVTPSGHAGTKFGGGSVNENRVIVITEDLTNYDDCAGPLPTSDCQYPLFYHIASFPAGALLKPGTADICLNPHPSEHDDLRLAHTDPNNPDDIELLPVALTSKFIDCSDIGVDVITDASLRGRALHFASVLASRIGRLLTPKLAYAIDQGGGGTFGDFSPFNWVNPNSGCEIECITGGQ